MSPDNYFIRIIENTAIEIQYWCKNEIQVVQAILEATEDALKHLYNTIEDLDNKKIYKKMIENLVKYCSNIIETYLGDSNKYSEHISFIETYQEKFKMEEPLYINYKKRPLGKIPLDIQENILKIKYNEDIKYYKRYNFLLYFTNPLVNYLKKKREGSIYYEI